MSALATPRGGGHGLNAEMAAGGQLIQVSTLQGAPGRGYRVDAEGAAGGHLVPLEPAYGIRTRQPGANGIGITTEETNALNTWGTQATGGSAGVRRLTPRECERLQGFPDDFTLIPGLKCPDSRRYAAMGNAVTVNVAEWVGRRILAVDRAGVDTPPVRV